MNTRTRVGTALLVATAGLALSLTACKKKTTDKGSSQELATASAMDGMGENDPNQPSPRPVEQAMEPGDHDDMAPPDMDPDADLGMLPTGDPTVPTAGQATARMILIPWKDAENLVNEVKRNKAEAKALAEKVLQEAKAKPTEANFTALVKKYSEGPLKENGGKVGPFGPKDMPPYFAKAVFALTKGGISEVVESKSGFHIFMRTQ